MQSFFSRHKAKIAGLIVGFFSATVLWTMGEVLANGTGWGDPRPVAEQVYFF